MSRFKQVVFAGSLLSLILLTGCGVSTSSSIAPIPRTLSAVGIGRRRGGMFGGVAPSGAERQSEH